MSFTITINHTKYKAKHTFTEYRELCKRYKLNGKPFVEDWQKIADIIFDLEEQISVLKNKKPKSR